MADERQGPAARPESTIAKSFAADLDSMFGLSGGSSGGVDALSQTVEEKKKDVSTGQSELELLEAKLRETEQRLARVSRQSSPSRPAQANSSAPLQPPTHAPPKPPHPLAQKPEYPGEQPQTGGARADEEQRPTASQQHGGRDDYVMVDDGNGR